MSDHHTELDEIQIEAESARDRAAERTGDMLHIQGIATRSEATITQLEALRANPASTEVRERYEGCDRIELRHDTRFGSYAWLGVGNLVRSGIGLYRTPVAEHADLPAAMIHVIDEALIDQRSRFAAAMAQAREIRSQLA